MASPPDELSYAGGGLRQETDWRGAFVIGLAGTILVTGIAPVMVTSLGASGVPVTVFITITGWILCLLLAELSAMMPERTGGAPSYAYPAYKDRWPGMAKHVNGFTAWAYWLGWFPVAPLNMILASFYLAALFNLSTNGITPIHTPIAWWTLGISLLGIALLSMLPMTFLAVAWVFRPSVVNWGELAGFKHLDGSGFFAPAFGHGWLAIYLAFAFLLTWNVIAMEAAACYIGETKNPERDGKIALNLEGGYGLFIYTLIPVAFIIVLGATQLSDPALVDPNTMFVTFAGKIFSTAGELLNWLIAGMLIIALVLSALNAIMGCARSLHQMSIDGQFPRFFQHTNVHGVPDRSMLFNTVCSMLLVFTGGAVEIYSFSNVGYTIPFIPVLVAYFLLRQHRPQAKRPFRLPEFMKYVALGLAVLYFVIWLFGGIIYTGLPNAALGGANTRVYFFLGWLVLLAYLPLYWYRTRVEDRRLAEAAGEAPATAAP